MDKYNETDLFLSMIKQICYEFAECNHLKEPLDLIDAITEAKEMIAQYTWRKNNINLQQFPSAEKYWNDRLKRLIEINNKLNYEDKI